MPRNLGGKAAIEAAEYRGYARIIARIRTLATRHKHWAATQIASRPRDRACVIEPLHVPTAALQLRIIQTNTTPRIALINPTVRNVLSGASSTDASARLAMPGAAANNSPSITNTSASAAMKSVTSLYRGTAGGVVAGGVVAGDDVLGVSRARPEGSEKNRKKSESGLMTSLVSLDFNPASYACIER